MTAKPRFSMGDRIVYTGPDDSRSEAVFERYQGSMWAWVRSGGASKKIRVGSIRTTVAGLR